jgi:hypothetical protein
MSKFCIRIEPVTSPLLLKFIGRKFQTEAERINGKNTLCDDWYEKPIGNYAEAYDMLKGRNELVLWQLRRWYKNITKKAEFNPGWYTADSIYIVACNYKASLYLPRLRFMRLAIELLKLGARPQCPREKLHLSFPETADALPKDALSIDHCMPITSGFNKTDSPISLCSWESNHTRGDIPWPVWIGCPCTLEEYCTICKEAKSCLKQYAVSNNTAKTARRLMVQSQSTFKANRMKQTV